MALFTRSHTPSWISEVSAFTGDKRSPIVWEPVEPADTHCFDVLDVHLDLKSDRTSEGRPEILGGDTTNLWQTATFRIAAWPRPKKSVITIRNVIFYSFVQFEFSGADPVDVLFQGREVLYHVEPLKHAGFNITSDQQFDTFGAFCLWVCPESPFLSSLIGRSPVQLRDNDRASQELRHFSLSCDDLGVFHLVGSSAEVVADHKEG
jgi:hypothetical protein